VPLSIAKKIVDEAEKTMLPVLLQSPIASFTEVTLADLVSQIHRHRRDHRGVCAISENEENRSFVVSSIGTETMTPLARAFAGANIRAAKVKIIVLLFPHHICAADERGRAITIANATGEPVVLAHRRVFKPLVWNDHLNDTINARLQMRPTMEIMQRQANDGLALASLKIKMGEELVREEAENAQLAAVNRKLATTTRRLNEALERVNALEKKKKALGDALQCMYKTAKALRSEMQTTRHSVDELLSTHARESSAVNTSLLAQLVRVAVQCAHYFQYDRFSNEFMRGSLIHDGATEGIRLATLLEFPRMCVLCEGDINMLRAACTLLEHVRVDDTCVWFE
jgi:hypothetical protein